MCTLCFHLCTRFLNFSKNKPKYFTIGHGTGFLSRHSHVRVIGDEGRKQLKITNNMIRLSLGLEDIEDLIEDIDNTLRLIK